MHKNAKYRAKTRKDSFTFVQDNKINEMVQTNSHRSYTHVKRLLLSASVVIIIITRLLATSRIITQYFNHLLLYSFTTSPLKIDEPLSTFQFLPFCGTSFVDLLCFCSVLCLLCLCARLFICALWSPAGKGLTSWLSFVVAAVGLSLSHSYTGSGVVLDCIDS